MRMIGSRFGLSLNPDAFNFISFYDFMGKYFEDVIPQLRPRPRTRLTI